MIWAAVLAVVVGGLPPVVSEEDDAWLSMRMIADEAEWIRRGGEVVRINREVTITLFPNDGSSEPGEEQLRHRRSVSVIGTLKPGEIERVAALHRKDVAHCLKGALSAGVVVVKVLVVASGRVASAYVLDSTIDDVPRGNCLAALTRGWSFPPNANGGIAIVTIPFRVTPRKQQPRGRGE